MTTADGDFLEAVRRLRQAKDAAYSTRPAADQLPLVKEDLLCAALPFIQGTPKVIVAGYGHLAFTDLAAVRRYLDGHNVEIVVGDITATRTRLEGERLVLSFAPAADLRPVLVFRGRATAVVRAPHHRRAAAMDR